MKFSSIKGQHPNITEKLFNDNFEAFEKKYKNDVIGADSLIHAFEILHIRGHLKKYLGVKNDISGNRKNPSSKNKKGIIKRVIGDSSGSNGVDADMEREPEEVGGSQD